MDADALQPLSLAAALAWAAGLRVYGVVFAVGLLGHFGWVELPGGLRALAHPAVDGVSGLLFLLEFFADKVPVIDSLWDAFNTFVRIPAGAALAAMALADRDPGWVIAAALVGGVLAGGTHAAKMGTRAAINLSPEPFSNWAASFTEDGMAAGILALAILHPLWVRAALAVFVVLLVWLLPKLIGAALRAMRAGFGRLRGGPA